MQGDREVVNVTRKMKMIWMAGTIAVALSISAFAADTSGLRAFLDTNSYWNGVFFDVPSGIWYEQGVKTVYEKGIMGGVSGNSFLPSDTVTWAQAVTVAARIHSVYHGKEIPTGSGAWYADYMNYMKKAGLLPASAPEEELVVSTVISRQELAGLFRSVISRRDLPRVNHSDIPDLEEVCPEFRVAVQDLYAAGIFTGKNGGEFDPNGHATRAEVAVVISRLIYPDQRVSYDSAADQNMWNQWGNFKNGGFAASMGEVTYYTAKERADTESWRYSIVARKNSGETGIVYETSGTLTRLAAADDGSLYFIENRNHLVKLDPVSGRKEILYKSPESVEHFVFYGGKIYILDCYSKTGTTADWKYRIGRVEKNSLVILVNNMKYGEVSNLDHFHAFDGKLYYSGGEEAISDAGRTVYRYKIWSLDLESGKTARVFDDELYMGDVSFSGATYWHYRENKDGRYEIVCGNLLMQEYEEVFAVLPESAKALYNQLYVNGKRVFFQSSGAARVWEISGGEVREFAQLPTAYYERSCVTEQGVILHALETLSVLLPQQIPVLLSDGNSVSYLEFLNIPYWENGCDLYEAVGHTANWEDTVFSEGEVSVVAETAYYTAVGDLVMEVSICNGERETITPTVLTVLLTQQDQQIEVVFYMPVKIEPGTENTYSLVVTAERLSDAFDLKKMERDILLKYTKQG